MSFTANNIAKIADTQGNVADGGVAVTSIALNTLDTSLAAGGYEGATRTLPVSGTVAVGDLCQMVNDSGLKWAISDVSTDTPADGICVLSVSTNRTVLLSGRYRFESSQTWSITDEIFRHATTDGDLQVGAPSTSTQKVQRLGKAEAADTILLNPSPNVFTVA